MSEQDRKTGKTRGQKRPNPGIEVVNVYGSGPLPVGEREPENSKPRRKSRPGQRGALSTSLEGKDRT